MAKKKSSKVTRPLPVYRGQPMTRQSERSINGGGPKLHAINGRPVDMKKRLKKRKKK